MQVGVASIAASVQRGGGSEQHPGSLLDDDLEVIAASIEAAALPEAHVFGDLHDSSFCGVNWNSVLTLMHKNHLCRTLHLAFAAITEHCLLIWLHCFEQGSA